MRAARILALPPVATTLRVKRRYDRVDGALLASGLAYSALFAIVPAVLLATGVMGLLVADPTRRGDAIAFVAAVIPPLHDLVQAVLDEAGRDAGALGIVGAATLAWGASRFVLVVTGTVSLVMGRPSRRGVLARNGAAVVAVLLLPFAIVAGAALAGLLAFLGVAEQHGLIAVLGGTLRLSVDLLPAVATILIIGLVYRIVPTPVAPWRAVWLPAVAVGIALTVLLQAFVFLAPRLVGAAALLGTLATVFAALAWLGLSFQALLLGAAWVGEREAAVQGTPRS